MAHKRVKINSGRKNKLVRALDLPTAFGPKIELTGNREAVIDDCKGIIEYYENRIKINLGKGTITFLGDGLHIGSMNESTAVITGKIQTVEFCV